MPSDPSKRFQLIVDKEFMKRVRAWAKKRKVTVSEAIRRLVDAALDDQKK